MKVKVALTRVLEWTCHSKEKDKHTQDDTNNGNI